MNSCAFFNPSGTFFPGTFFRYGSRSGSNTDAAGNVTTYAYDANGDTHQLYAHNNLASFTTGAGGVDTLSFARGSGADTVVENIAAGGQDIVQYVSNVASDQLWFQQSGNDLVVSIMGTSDSETFTNWYQSSANQTAEFIAGDSKVLLASQVDNLVSVMASFSPPSMGQTSLSALSTDEQAALATPLAANWQ